MLKLPNTYDFPPIHPWEEYLWHVVRVLVFCNPLLSPLPFFAVVENSTLLIIANVMLSTKSKNTRKKIAKFTYEYPETVFYYLPYYYFVCGKQGKPRALWISASVHIRYPPYGRCRHSSDCGQGRGKQSHSGRSELGVRTSIVCPKMPKPFRKMYVIGEANGENLLWPSLLYRNKTIWRPQWFGLRHGMRCICYHFGWVASYAKL